MVLNIITDVRDVRLHITRLYGEIDHDKYKCLVCTIYRMGIDDALAEF